MKSDKRNIAVNKIVVPPQVKKESEIVKKPPNIFGTVQSKPQLTKDVKNESNSASNSANVKKEKISPNRSPGKKNQAAAKPTGKMQQGKSSSSIASFFGKKPSTASAPSTTHDKSVSDAAAKIEKVKIKDEPIVDVKSEPTNTSKRYLSNASGKDHTHKLMYINK